MSLRPATKYHQHRGNRLVTGPTHEPVTVSELRTALRLALGQEEEFLQQLIVDAREEIESATGLALLTQTWRLTLDMWPSGREKWWDGTREAHINDLYVEGSRGSVELPRYPLQSVESVTVYDEDGTSAAVTIANVFDVDTASQRGRLTLQRGAVWPVALRANNAIEIVYVAGYGDTYDTVPGPLRRAVRQMAGHMYEHRGDCDAGDALKDSGALAIVSRYKVTGL